MKIGIISLVSDVHDPDTVNQASIPILNTLKESFQVEEIEPQQVKEVDLPVVLVKTGGTEHKFKQIFPILEEIGRPVTLLATASNNSLPASLEILSWLNSLGLIGLKNNRLLHGPLSSLKGNVEKRMDDLRILEALKRSRFGVIGRPSDWLIASSVDYEMVSKRWGTSIVDVPLQEVLDYVGTFSEEEVKHVLPRFSKAQFKEGVTDDNIAGAVKIYLALEKIIAHYQLTAFTLRCFNLLEPLQNTGCLSLSRLNDEGITAGCEGDVPALFTMYINQLITGKPAFMANPSRIDDNVLTLAHCTVAPGMVKSFGFKTHFESGLGVGIAGTFEPGPVTVSKIGGLNLDRYYVAEGELTGNLQAEDLCRTQITIRMDEGTEYYFKRPLGNHHIVSNGPHAKRFKEVMALFEVSGGS